MAKQENKIHCSLRVKALRKVAAKKGDKENGKKICKKTHHIQHRSRDGFWSRGAQRVYEWV